MRIDSTGLVGIGNSSPSNNLEVSTPSNGGGITVQAITGTNVAPALHLNPIAASTEGRNWSIAPFKDTPQSLSFSSSDAKGGNAYSAATTRLLIDGISGNVGIGSSSPTTNLDVSTTAAVNPSIRVSGSYADGYRVGFEAHNGHTGGATWTTLSTNNSDGVFGGGKYVIANAAIGSVTSANARMVISSSGLVGISTSSPLFGLSLAQGSGDGNKIGWNDAAGYKRASILSNSSNDNLEFRVGTSDTLAASIDSAGNVLVGTTSSSAGDGNTNTGVSIQAGGRLFASSTNDHNFNRNSSGQIIAWRNSGSKVGSVSISGSSTSYNTSSDYRLKTDVQPMTGATATFKQLKPVNFEWISSGERVDGFLAHELAEVIPAATSGDKDAMRDEEYEVTAAVEATYDDEGAELTAAVDAVTATRSVPDMQGIDQSKIVPLLTAALQEAIAKIESLETRLTALEV
jgi:hypothetical protein